MTEPTGRNHPHEERALAAYHEAGHVVVRHEHGLVTPSFYIRPDGSGYTFPGGQPILDLTIHLNIAMAGLAAEGRFTGHQLLPTDIEIEEAWGEGEFYWGDEDIGGATRLIRQRAPAATLSQVIKVIRRSCEHARTILDRRWQHVEQLAKAAIESEDGVVIDSTITMICGSLTANNG